MSDSKRNFRQSFTLIELLVVLAIVAILSVVVIMTLNPSELLKQARDSNRLSDLSTLNTALSAYSADVNGGFMGTSSVVYVSLVDTTSSTCSGLGLPALPTGYTYNCPTSEANLKRADGTGWIPVNFSNISFGSPLSSLPVDPINTTSSRNYYTYVSGGSYELAATLEAAKNKLGGASDKVSSDGGDSTSLYETGNNRNLLPVDYGDSSLVGYWNFEEGPSTTSTDRSGYGNHGTWNGGGTHYASGKVGNYAGEFNGINDVVAVLDNGAVLDPTSITMSSWIFPTVDQAGEMIAKNGNSGYRYRRNVAETISVYDRGCVNCVATVTTVPLNTWEMVTVTGDSSGIKIYFDGVLNYSGGLAYAPGDNAAPLYIGGYAVGSELFAGTMDDVRVYNRALSAAEILALYNATR